MPEEKPDPKQQISAGDASQNYQAARDMHFHNPTEQKHETSIVKPNFDEMKKYDPKLRQIMEAASKDHISFELRSLHMRSYGIRGTFVALIVWLVILFLLNYGLGIDFLDPISWMYSALKSLWNTL